MTRGCLGALVAIALAAGLVFRLARLDARPMHHDEANQAVKFGALLERGEYRYDAHDHHGPTLYYLSLPAAKLRGQTTFASLDERTLRGVTAVFGAATILLLPLLAAGIGRTAVAASAWLLALSPAMVYYSRMFIQESLFACFTLAFVVAIGRWRREADLRGPRWRASRQAWRSRPRKRRLSCCRPRSSAGAMSWSSLLRNPSAAGRSAIAVLVGHRDGRWRSPRCSTRRFSPRRGPSSIRFAQPVPYLDRAIDPESHVHPWHYYLGLLAYSSSGGLTWSEGLVLALAIVGAVTSWGLPDRSRPERAFWARYFTCYVAATTAIFSAIPYKTPWNLLPFYVGAIVLAGIGFSTLLHTASSRVVRGAVVAAFVLASGHLAWQAWRASVTYASDPRNPYVYAQTVPDAVRMATRIRQLAALHPDGVRMQVSVIASPHEQWPFPWYLRAMPHVGYWTAPGDALALKAPVVVASMDHTAVLDSALGDRYVSEFYGLRPEVLLMLYVERGLWERFLARPGQASTGQAGAAGDVRAATGASARASQPQSVRGTRPLWPVRTTSAP